jgi:hypothetical protein
MRIAVTIAVKARPASRTRMDAPGNRTWRLRADAAVGVVPKPVER